VLVSLFLKSGFTGLELLLAAKKGRDTVPLTDHKGVVGLVSGGEMRESWSRSGPALLVF
jgi:hypothetical protein